MTAFDQQPLIFNALLEVMDAVRVIRKDSKQQNFNFRGIDAVLNAVGPEFRRVGIIPLPRVVSMTHRDFTTKGGTTMHEAVVEVEYTFAARDGSTVVCSTVGESADAGDKASTKAMSVAYRTALLQVLCMPTDEPDPDLTNVERSESPDDIAASLGWRDAAELDEAWRDLVADTVDPLVQLWVKEQQITKRTFNREVAAEWASRLEDQPLGENSE